MTYLDRPPPPKGPPWAHNSLGASVHNALAGWWRLPRAGRTVAAAGDLLDGGWIDQGFASDAQSAAVRATGAAAWWSATRRRSTRPRSRWAWSARWAPAPSRSCCRAGSTGWMSAAARPGDRELAVVDYKTGRRPLTTDDARTSMPLALYALAAARMFRRPCRRVELHHLPTAHGARLGAHRRGTLARQVRRAEEHRGRVRGRRRAVPGRAARPAEVDEVFPPRPGPGLWLVRLPRSCAPRDRRPRPRASPWDGLDAGRLIADLVSGAPGALVYSTEFQNLVRVLATVSGASTAGECAAPGMQTRCGAEPVRHVVLDRRLPGVVVLAVEHQQRGAPSVARAGVRSGQASRTVAHRPQPGRAAAAASACAGSR